MIVKNVSHRTFFAPAKMSSLGFYFNSLIYAPIGVKLLNGQIRVLRVRGVGVVRAWWRRKGHKGHASLKFEKDGSLA